MNKQDIGNKLSKLRKKNNLTPTDVANKMHVKERTVLNWEAGEKLPRLSQFKALASIYNVNLSKLVDEELLLNRLLKQRKINLFLGILCGLLTLVGILLLILYFNGPKNGELKIYNFKGESEHFLFRDGLVVISNDQKYIEIANFDVKDNFDVQSMSINIAFNESIWGVKDYRYADHGPAKEWLNQLKFTEYGQGDKSEIIKRDLDSFIKYDAKLFPNDFKVEINYCTKNECTVELLDIETTKLSVHKK